MQIVKRSFGRTTIAIIILLVAAVTIGDWDELSESFWPAVVGSSLWIYTLVLLLGSSFDMRGQHREQEELITTGEHFAIHQSQETTVEGSGLLEHSTAASFTNQAGTSVITRHVAEGDEAYGSTVPDRFLTRSTVADSREEWQARTVVFSGVLVTCVAVSAYTVYTSRLQIFGGKYPSWGHVWTLLAVLLAGLATLIELRNGIDRSSETAFSSWYAPVLIRGVPARATIAELTVQARWFNRLWSRYLTLTIDLPIIQSGNLVLDRSAGATPAQINAGSDSRATNSELSATFLVPKEWGERLANGSDHLKDGSTPVLVDPLSGQWALCRTTTSGYLIHPFVPTKAPQPWNQILRWVLVVWSTLFALAISAKATELFLYSPEGYRLQPWLSNSSLLVIVGTSALLHIGLVWGTFKLTATMARGRHWLVHLAGAIAVVGAIAAMVAGALLLFVILVFGAFDGKRFEHADHVYLAEPAFMDPSSYSCYRYEGLFWVKKLGFDAYSCSVLNDSRGTTETELLSEDGEPPIGSDADAFDDNQTAWPSPPSSDSHELLCETGPDECFISVWNGRPIYRAEAQQIVDREQVHTIAGFHYGWVIADAAAGARWVFLVEKQDDQWIFLSEMPSVRGVAEANYSNGVVTLTNMDGKFSFNPVSRRWESESPD
ncbi:MAG: hypothetical protein Q4P71_05150 [Actinomycetaceae bacterium]|nr:hypothetical protein [Actinomycetaceae bacterium]